MANFTTADIKALREKTGAGMLDVKKALDEAEGNVEKALEIIRVKGLKGIAKREGRSASAGLILVSIIDEENGQAGVMIELNSETDFVAKNEKFIDFANKVMQAGLDAKATTIEELLAAPSAEGTVQDLVDSIAAVIGEKIVVRRIVRLTGEKVTSYLHYTSKDLPPQVGVLVATDTNGETVARDVAMHIAAYSPEYLGREDVPADIVEKERATLEETTREEGKPEAAIAKIVEGRMAGFYKECVLLDQPYAKDPKVSVGQVVADAKGELKEFARFRVGA